MKLTSLIIKPIPDEYASEFRMELLKDNISRIKVFSILTIIGSVIFLLIDIANYVNGLWTSESVYIYQFYSHLIIFIVMLVFVFLLMVRRRKHNPLPVYIWFEYFFILFIIEWSAVSLVVQMPVSSSTAFYMVTCFMVAVGVYANIFISIAAYALSFAIILLGLNLFVNDVNLIRDYLTECSMIAMISFVISRLVFKKRTEVFINYKKIEKEIFDRDQAEMSLQKLNADLESIVHERTKSLIVINDRLSNEILERKKLEQNLINEKSILENIIEHNPYAISLYDQNGFFIQGNPAGKKLFLSFPPSSYSIFNDASLIETHKQNLTNLRAGKTIYFQSVFYNRDFINTQYSGNDIYVKSVMFPIQDHQGTVHNYIQIFEDITDRQKAESDLKQSEERFRLIVENIEEGIYSTKNGCFTSVNPVMEKMFGYTEKEFTNMSAWELSIPENRENVKNEFFRKTGTKDISPMTVECVKKNGTVFFVEVRISGVSDKGQEYGIVHDITDRKRAEEILIDSEERYRILIDNMSDVFFLLDISGNLVYISKLFEAFSGYKIERVQGKSFMDLIYPDDLKGYIDNFSNTLSGNQEPFECRFKTATEKKCYVKISCKLIVKDDGTKQIVGILSDISQQKEIENNLRMLESAINQSFDGIAVTDLDGNFIYLNDSWAKLHGYSKQELQYKNLKLCHSKQQVFEDVIPFNTIVMREGMHQGEVGHITKEGAMFPTWMATTLLRDSLNKPVGLIGIARDITVLKQAEDELKKSEKKYKNLFERAPSGILTVDLNGNVQDANSATLQILGSPSLEMTKQINVLTFPNLIDAGISQKLQECIATAETLVGEHHYTTMWNKSLMIRIHYKPVFDDDDNIIEVLSIIDDISKEKEHERKECEQLDQLKHISETISDGVFQINHNGEFIYANDSFFVMTGYFKTELFEIKINDIQFANDIDLLKDIFEISAENSNLEFRIKRKDSSFFWALLSSSPHKNKQGNEFITVVMKNITERKDLQTEIVNYKSKLQNSEKHHAFILKTLVHDMKIPVNAIQGFAQLLKKSEQNQQVLQYTTVSLIDKSELLLKVVNDFVLLSQIENRSLVISKTTINMVSFLDEIVALFSNDADAIRKKLTIKHVLNPLEINQIHVDHKLIKRVLADLIKNAIKNTHYGTISIGCKINEHEVMFSVQDTGIGVAPEKQKNYFDLMQRSFSKENVAGISSLLICKGLVENMGGKIWIESDEGKGSVFYFTIAI